MDAKVDKALLEEPSPDEMLTLMLRLMRGVNGQAFRLFGDRVQMGPFSGMIIPSYTEHWDDGNSGTKLLGIYEHELHKSIDHAIWRNPRTMINVGCAEGYYAVGFARLGAVDVYAMDIKKEILKVCQEYAKKNSAKVDTREGAHDPEELRLEEISGNRLYIIDCEGAEVELIDLKRCPELVHSDIIVECHDFMRYGASRTIAERLNSTHRLELIRPGLPDFNQLPFLHKYPNAMAMLMAVEKRPMPCYWLACWANSRGEQDG